MLVEEYLSPVNFDLETTVTSNTRVKVQSLEQQLRGLAITSPSPSEDLTAAKMNRNIVQIALFLEGFGCFAKVQTGLILAFTINIIKKTFYTELFVFRF